VLESYYSQGPPAIEGMNKGSQAGTLVLFALLLITLGAVATPRLAVTAGFSGRFVPEHLAPLRVEISNIGASFSGTLVISQRVGNPWRGEAESRIEFPLRLSGAEELECVVPIYDFIHPLEVALLSEEEKILAEEVLELRAYRQEEPFPLAVGAFPVGFDEMSVVIDSKALPRQWAAYEATSSLWVGRIAGGISKDQGQAIGQWVLAGGTLVLFTGTDFYLVDSPILRELLPLENPRLVDTNGVTTLHGETREGTRTILTRNETPLLLVRRVGAGTVLLVTASAFALVETEFSAIKAHVPTAKLISFGSDVAGLLEETPLQRPGYLAASLLVLGTLTSFTLVASRTRSAKATLTLLLAASGLFCVLSGFYTNQAKTVTDVYFIKTSLYLQAFFGSNIDYYGLFGSTVDSSPVNVKDPATLIQELPRNLQGHNFDIDVGEGTRLSLARGESRFLHGFSAKILPITVSPLEGKKVRVKNGLDEPLRAALLIKDGTAFPIDEVRVGEESYALRGGVPLEDAALGAEHFTTLFRTLAEDFSLAEGVWLVGAWEEQGVEHCENTRVKVRDLALVVIAGGEA